MSIGKTGHVLVRTSHSRGQLKGQRFQSSKSAMSGGLKLRILRWLVIFLSRCLECALLSLMGSELGMREAGG
jgi:hypothetical protein